MSNIYNTQTIQVMVLKMVNGKDFQINNVIMGKENIRGCEAYQCQSLIDHSHTIRDLPPPETKGIFVIKENGVIIYIGKSGDCMRERILSHLAGYDAQEIGKYMKTLSKEYKMSSITVSWVQVDAPSCDEHHYIDCLAERQKEWPKCNLKRGRPIKKE